MNRSNIGNVTTNATQILSVGATTASGIFRRLGHAEDNLNNTNFEGLPMTNNDYKNNNDNVKKDSVETHTEDLTSNNIKKDNNEMYVEDLSNYIARKNNADKAIEEVVKSLQSKHLYEKINADFKYYKNRRGK